MSEKETLPPFLAAAKGLEAARVPVWFMRQAGRSLPEYRKLRGSGPIRETLWNPELVAEITMQPVRRYGVDAAILYSDIMVPLMAIEAGVEIVANKGPQVNEPFLEPPSLKRLRDLNPEQDTPFLKEAITDLLGKLDVPLIGFAGAPFTLASYLIEGGPSKDYARTKEVMSANPNFFSELLSRLADISIQFLIAQIEAGVSAVQLFDSWAGMLSPEDYEHHVLRHSARVFEAVSSYEIPMIHFGVKTGELLGLLAKAGSTIVGVDWRVPLSFAREQVPPGIGLQGNLDPTLCLGPWEKVEEGVKKVLAENAGHPGFIFNLGHGVLPQTDPEILARVVDYVHKYGKEAQ